MAANLNFGHGEAKPELHEESSAERDLSLRLDPAKGLRMAVVHEWLATYAGSEMVLAEILALYPQADLFAIVDFLPRDRRILLGDRKITVSFIQHLPFAKKKFRWYLPLMPLAIEQLDLSAYDLIISSSHAVSKGVLTRSHQLHISYVHTPIRYAWDQQEDYLKGTATGRIRGAFARLFMHYLRIWDLRSAAGVDYFIANSQFIARRILKTYRREASVLYPPVALEKFSVREQKDDFYVTVGRMVPYKRMDLLLEAFAMMPDRKLIIIGDGPELPKLRRRASSNVHLTGHVSDAEMTDYMARAKAFVYAGEEDFGISMVEAQACGTPVLAFSRGGAAEIIVDGETGLLFDRQDAAAIKSAVAQFEQNWHFEPWLIRRNAMRFNTSRFKEGLKAAVNDALREHQASVGGPFRTYPLTGKEQRLPLNSSRRFWQSEAT
jgi:glycosyltransferase involved in cell wall biosynthesis